MLIDQILKVFKSPGVYEKYSLLLFIIYGCLNFSALSQKLVEPEKKMYKATDGKIYSPKSEPIYLFVSLDSDDKSDKALLKTETSPSTAIPIYLEAEGLNTIRSPWAVDPKTKNIVWPKREVIFEVYADGHPPVTHISFDSAKTFLKEGKRYISGKARVSLSARDEISGVSKIFYAIDAADYKEYSSPIVLDSSKEYLIKYYSTDQVGNVEKLKDSRIVVDNTKPKTSVEIKGDKFENVLAGNTSVVFGTSDNSSGIAVLNVKLDGKSIPDFTGTIRSSMLHQGEHKIEFYAEDNVGNQEELQVFDFYVDKTAPTILQDIIGKTFMSNGKEFSSGRSQLKLTALDNRAGVKAVYYSINNSEYKLYDKPVFLKVTKGNMSVKAYAIDNVNNKSEIAEEANEQQIPYVDLTGPTVKYGFLGQIFVASDTTYISNRTKIQFLASDNESGVGNIQYSIDNKENTTYEAPISVENEGWHVIDYVGTDNVDNTTSGNLKVMVDNSGPSIFPTFSTASNGSVTADDQTLDVYPAHVCLFVSATDSGSGYDHMTYILNGGTEKLFAGFIREFSKKNEIILKVYDKLGNESSVTLSFKVSQ